MLDYLGLGTVEAVLERIRCRGAKTLIVCSAAAVAATVAATVSVAATLFSSSL